MHRTGRHPVRSIGPLSAERTVSAAPGFQPPGAADLRYVRRATII